MEGGDTETAVEIWNWKSWKGEVENHGGEELNKWSWNGKVELNVWKIRTIGITTV
jgi:hypothetical protein